jgi:hypothetical protein
MFNNMKNFNLSGTSGGLYTSRLLLQGVLGKGKPVFSKGQADEKK